jgi:asparagine synthase (glutamine-hydrolysing)
VAKFLGTDHHEDRLSATSAANLVSEIGAWMDEPFSDPSTGADLSFIALHTETRDGRARGDGGDELFAGYPMYAGLRWAEFYRRVPPVLRASVVEPLVRLLPVKTKNLSFDYKAARFITEQSTTQSRVITFGSDRSHRKSRWSC